VWKGKEREEGREKEGSTRRWRQREEEGGGKRRRTRRKEGQGSKNIQRVPVFLFKLRSLPFNSLA
jgi:hypothetical protein